MGGQPVRGILLKSFYVCEIHKKLWFFAVEYKYIVTKLIAFIYKEFIC